MAGNDLLSFLRSLQVQCGGKIPFERFMQEALYHPEFGYYSANIRDVGPHGDFSTSPTLDQRLGIAIAAWIRDRSKELRWKRSSVIEVGAGNGTLASTVLRNIGWLKRLRTDYTIVEASPVLRMRQQKLLGRRGVTWSDSMEEALCRFEGRALIFSNELVDAFPCRVFEKTDKGWSEVGIRIASDDSLKEVLSPVMGNDPWFEEFEAYVPGHRVERHDSYREWLSSWRPKWKEGALLTIDYGCHHPAQTVPSKEGTLRAYWRHQRFTGMDIYARFGKQDITADVNFHDLEQWGSMLDLKNLGLRNQRSFLSLFCNPTRNGQLPRDQQLSEALEYFQVLEQAC